MKTISAFVGHSFNAVDQPVVDAILQLLDRVAQLHPAFSWEHATEPEPGEVSAKVFRLFEGKNLFIAICTKSEFAISSGSLLSVFSYGVAQKTKFAAKPSDWVIQELGFALGRGIKIIILLEDGVRRPGALQADLEYIPFNRSKPEAVAEKLLGMLANILAPTNAENLASDAQEVIAKSEPPKAEPQENRDVSAFVAPNEKWEETDYRIGYWFASHSKDDDLANNIRQAFLTSNLGQDDDKRKRFLAWMETARIENSNGGSLRTLENLVEQTNGDSEAQAYLADALDHFNEWKRAGIQYEKAAASSKDDASRVRLLGKAAICYKKCDEEEAEQRVIESMRGAEDASDLAYAIAKSLSSVYETDRHLAIAAYEHMLEFRPDDYETRFNLAYQYDSLNIKKAAHYHYALIPESARSGAAWNNLAVTQDDLKMPAASLRSYREASKLGETLADANIGLKFLNAGFKDEAVQVLTEAAKRPDHHVNVDRHLISAKEVDEAESKKHEETLREARPQSEFYRQVGKALIQKTPLELPAEWKSPNANLIAKIKDAQFEAVGIFEQKLNALMGLFQQAETVTMQERYTGQVKGRTIVGTVSREKVGARPTSLLSHGLLNQTFVMWLNEAGDELSVKEIDGSTERFYTIGRTGTRSAAI